MDIMVIEFFVPGVPKTKGSMNSYGGNRLRQSVKGSVEWGKRVQMYAYNALVDLDWDDSSGSLFPSPLPVAVYCEFYLPRPSGNTDLYPTRKSSGDSDKLVRNVFDALQQAGVYEDDSQVVEQSSCKHFESEDLPKGVHIVVFGMVNDGIRNPPTAIGRGISLFGLMDSAVQPIPGRFQCSHPFYFIAGWIV